MCAAKATPAYDGRAQRSLTTLSGAFASLRSASLKSEIGTSGIVPKVVSSWSFFVTRTLATRSIATSPCSGTTIRGSDSPGYLTNHAPPASPPGSTGVVTDAVPILVDAGQAPASYVASGQPFCSGLMFAATDSGSVTRTLLIAAWPPACVSVAVSGVFLRAAVLPLPPTRSVSLGANGSARQPLTWKRLSTVATAPPAPPTIPRTAVAAHEVGLNMKPGRSIASAIERIRSGTPLTTCGNGSESTVSAAVARSTSIAARTTTSPRSNGPAFAGTTIERPYGAPL